ncbi:fungal-specific transcription factor domain-containing protein [Phellopilus nigrolimitatus]|nr:fungal-specific transcription factor domain-containing protein [Phellopilus nigrolimitatus]
MSPHEIEQGMQQPHMHSPQAHMPVEPSLQLYYPSYNPYQQGQPDPHQQQQHQQQPNPPMLPQQPPMHSQLNVPALSPQSSSSQGSEYMGTPPTEGVPSSSRHVKRPSSSSANGSMFGSRKKSRLDEKDDDDMASPSAENPEGKVKATRGSRACTVCRRLKMKCVGAEHGPPCKRCESGNHQCIFEESNRGKRSSNNNVKKHEQLTRSLRKMEKTLDTVLRSIGNPSLSSIASGMVSRSPSPTDPAVKTQELMQTPSPTPHSVSTNNSMHHRSGSPRLHSLPDNELNPLGLLAEASLANRRAQNISQSQAGPDSYSLDADHKVGVASDLYFKPGPMTILPLRRLYIERQIQPEMLNFVSTEEVVALFKIFFEHMNVHLGLLDPDFHTPSLVCSRSPILLTTICAISSKFYSARPDLHPKLSSLSRKLAFSVPEQGYKSVEIVQAYLLLSLWGCGPVERFEQDKTWFLLGMGIRMATDLNLHRKTATLGQDTPEGCARDKEVHNRERTWLICYILDRSMSAQMGKPHSIKEDFIIQNTALFWTKPLSRKGDGGIAAYAELQRILSRSLDLLYSSTTSASGLQMNCDYYLVTRTIEAQLHSWLDEWDGRLVHFEGTPVTYVMYWTSIGNFYYNYAMLVVNSFGLQNALERSPVDIGHFFTRCHSSAVACATLVRDELGPRGFLRYSPDSHFVQISYAVLSLLKFTRPTFHAFLVDEKKTIMLIQEIADLLESIAAGPLHTPALYSTFLRALISVQTDRSTRHSSPQFDPMLRKQEHVGGDGHPSSTTDKHLQNGGESGAGASLGLLGSSFDGATTPGSYQFNSEMGPVADITTFPPTMAPTNSHDDASGMLSMDSILSTGFWDSVLVPGYSNALEGLSGGFVYGAGGSGLITPRLSTPQLSGTNTPTVGSRTEPMSENSIHAAFGAQPEEGGKLGS